MRIAEGWCFCTMSHLQDSAAVFPGLPGARHPAKHSLCIVFCILSIVDEERGAQSSERWGDLPEFAQPATSWDLSTGPGPLSRPAMFWTTV